MYEISRETCSKSRLTSRYRVLIFSTLLTVLAGCGGSTNAPVVTPVQISPPTTPQIPTSPVNEGAGLAVPDNRTVPEFRILLLGNSHVGFNDLAGLIQQMLQTGRSQAKVHVQLAGGAGYLDERRNDNTTLTLLKNQSWSHVILQGQKYSTTGLYHYSIEAALYWVALIKSRQGTPIMFPEHATLGNSAEGARIYQLHQSIVQQEAACLAPVPQAWEASLTQWPETQLHMSDGNHANQAGAVLTAMLFYQVITGNPADQLPYIAGLDLSATVQQRLAQQASASLQQHPACPF